MLWRRDGAELLQQTQSKPRHMMRFLLTRIGDISHPAAVQLTHVRRRLADLPAFLRSHCPHVIAQCLARGALVLLERALLLAAPDGYVRVFVDEGTPMGATTRVGVGRRRLEARLSSPRPGNPLLCRGSACRLRSYRSNTSPGATPSTRSTLRRDRIYFG